MAMKNPPHPGRSIKDACLEPLQLSVTEGARVLGVTRHTLSRVINGQSGISPDMAIRLAKAGWSNADHWLRLQTAYELARARQPDQILETMIAGSEESLARTAAIRSPNNRPASKEPSRSAGAVEG